MSYKTLGIMGGMGPAATVCFFDEVVRHTVAGCDQEHLDIVITNHSTLPDRTEAIRNGDPLGLCGQLQEDARKLERMGAQLIAMPCNTGHLWIGQIRDAVEIPVIDMIRETLKVCADKGDGHVGVLATAGTVESDLYGIAARELGLEVRYPSPVCQAGVTAVIYDEVKGGRAVPKGVFEGAVEEMVAAGCTSVALACTELSVYAHRHEVSDVCVDALDVLVRASIEAAGATYR